MLLDILSLIPLAALLCTVFRFPMLVSGIAMIHREKYRADEPCMERRGWIFYQGLLLVVDVFAFIPMVLLSHIVFWRIPSFWMDVVKEARKSGVPLVLYHWDVKVDDTTKFREVIFINAACALMDLLILPALLVLGLSVYRIPTTREWMADIDQKPLTPGERDLKLMYKRLACLLQALLVLLELPILLLGLVTLILGVRARRLIELCFPPSTPIKAKERYILVVKQFFLSLREWFFLILMIPLLISVYRGFVAIKQILDSVSPWAPDPPVLDVTSIDAIAPERGTGLQLRITATKQADFVLPAKTAVRLYIRNPSTFWNEVGSIFGGAAASVGPAMLPLAIAPKFLDPSSIGTAGSTTATFVIDFCVSNSTKSIAKNLQKFSQSSLSTNGVCDIQLEIGSHERTLLNARIHLHELGVALTPIAAAGAPGVAPAPVRTVAAGVAAGAPCRPIDSFHAPAEVMRGARLWDVLWRIVGVQFAYLMLDLVAIVCFVLLHFIPHRVYRVYTVGCAGKLRKDASKAIAVLETVRLVDAAGAASALRRACAAVDADARAVVAAEALARAAFAESRARAAAGQAPSTGSATVAIVSGLAVGALRAVGALASRTTSASSPVTSTPLFHWGGSHVSIGDWKSLAPTLRHLLERSYSRATSSGEFDASVFHLSTVDERMLSVLRTAGERLKSENCPPAASEAVMRLRFAYASACVSLRAALRAKFPPHMSEYLFPLSVKLVADAEVPTPLPAPAGQPTATTTAGSTAAQLGVMLAQHANPPALSPAPRFASSVDDVVSAFEVEAGLCSLALKAALKEAERAYDDTPACDGKGGWPSFRSVVMKEIKETVFDLAAVVSFVVVFCSVYRTYPLLRSVFFPSREERHLNPLHSKRLACVLSAVQIVADLLYLIKAALVIVGIRGAFTMPLDFAYYVFLFPSFRTARKVVDHHLGLLVADILQVLSLVFAWDAIRVVAATFVFGLFAPGVMLESAFTRWLADDGSSRDDSFICRAAVLIIFSAAWMFALPFVVAYVWAVSNVVAARAFFLALLAFVVLSGLLVALCHRDVRLLSTRRGLVRTLRPTWHNATTFLSLLLEAVQLLALLYAPGSVVAGTDTRIYGVDVEAYLPEASRAVYLIFGSGWTLGHIPFGVYFALACSVLYFMLSAAPVVIGDMLHWRKAGALLRSPVWIGSMQIFGQWALLTVARNLALPLMCPIGSGSGGKVEMLWSAGSECWVGRHQGVAAGAMVALVYYVPSVLMRNSKYDETVCHTLDVVYPQMYRILVNTGTVAAAIGTLLVADSPVRTAVVVLVCALWCLFWTLAFRAVFVSSVPPSEQTSVHPCSVATMRMWRAAVYGGVAAAAVFAIIAGVVQPGSPWPLIAAAASVGACLLGAGIYSIYAALRRTVEADTIEECRAALLALEGTVAERGAWLQTQVEGSRRVQAGGRLVADHHPRRDNDRNRGRSTTAWRRRVGSATRVSQLAQSLRSLEKRVDALHLTTLFIQNRIVWACKVDSLIAQCDNDRDLDALLEGSDSGDCCDFICCSTRGINSHNSTHLTGDGVEGVTIEPPETATLPLLLESVQALVNGIDRQRDWVPPAGPTGFGQAVGSSGGGNVRNENGAGPFADSSL